VSNVTETIKKSLTTIVKSEQNFGSQIMT